jgi:NAD(P)-dependent dehydrogenase (short-subunit alcohol dehydrogenase family)
MRQAPTAIVTGAASGLGRAIAVELGRRGWHVALTDVNDAANEESLALVRAAGGSGQTEHLDVTQPAQWESLRDRLQEDWPQLDLLVNNAGVGMGGEVGKLALADWRFIIEINLHGPIFGCHTMIDWLKENSRGGNIVNIASMAAIASAPGMAAYNVTKAGVVSLSETLYNELKPHNIGVTAVCPDFFPTNIARSARFESPAQRRLAERLTNDGRLSADEVARRVVASIGRRPIYLFVPAMASLIWRLKRMWPALALNVVARYMRKKAETTEANAEASELPPPRSPNLPDDEVALSESR